MRRLTPETLRIPTQPVRLGAAVAQPIPREPIEREDDAKKMLQTAYDEARDRGFDEGMKDAAREIDRRVEKIAQRLEREHADETRKLQERESALRRLCEGVADAIGNFGKGSEDMAVEAAYAALVRLLGASAADRSLLQTHCLAVIREFGDPPATLRVSEGDLELLDLAALPLPVEADRRLASGQCIIETARGQFDCGLDARLDAIQQAFLTGLREHRSASA